MHTVFYGKTEGNAAEVPIRKESDVPIATFILNKS